ncbi:MAG: nucleotidyltransferase domain-containing protein [Euryarchaeota archaeon]|nr:nucleotidyltransferase domain-containing protein [Euryarchaeota archaeon]
MENIGQGNTNYEDILKRIVDRIGDKLGEDVLSIVLFGSMIRREFIESSNIDMLVIARNLPDYWRGRYKILIELAEIRSDHERPVHITLTYEYEMNASIDQGAPLAFGLHDANRVIFGRDRFFEKLMRQLEDNMKRWGVKKIGNGEWFAPGLAVIDA